MTKRELNQNTAQVLAAVDAGEAVVVTERGVPRWRIEPVTEEVDPFERLIREGKVKLAKANPPPWPRLTGRKYTSEEIQELIDWRRGDR